jgi:hypothetical protein
VRGRLRFIPKPEFIMLFVAASDLSLSDLALLGNNIRPMRHKTRIAPDERANRRVIAAVNRSLASLRERVDRLDPAGAGPDSARRKLAS